MEQRAYQRSQQRSFERRHTQSFARNDLATKENERDVFRIIHNLLKNRIRIR
ncbi:hypothetical protein [Pontibacter sp. HSC-36F09]|uniref:hypothetical protein n=1 Tax=Pontibacter sp. HSC-36F09 TaxID=2910966 RepID=UPI00209D5CA9|nr:hypothetical protein [Pontibacter sp. HSC-36F09]MCP2045115.1 hypothetical protein [Pontibacter sp. HSC-36F09]